MSKGDHNNNNNNRGMKVVHIKTQYVTTDATSFKSVVQNLTGKDSTIPESPRRKSSSSSSSSIMALKVKNNRDQNNNYNNINSKNVLDKVGGGSFKYLSKELSFGRLLKEFPSVDELHKLLNF
ncbi:hypothetical protein RND81_11G141000 [Saponaria officinalis]|uniref:VQ domain-containing protein n=1 Tax=Saponaria officinalis TaxID=3572 RepID=A0AAW1HMF6_SAPOF